jgi:uncharacterized tellurite resistance protein B-like protein
MLSRIKEILTMRIGPGEDPLKVEQRRHVAAAVLLLAVARADDVFDAREHSTMQQALQRSFGLDKADIAALLVVAEEEADSSTSDYAFTRLINQDFTDAEKSALVGEMWRVAYADGDLHKYEEHLIRKIAVLINVPHGEFIRTKLQVAEAMGIG